MIKFDDHDLGKNWFDILRSRLFISAYTHDILVISSNHGGFCAGGTGSMFAKYILADERCEQAEDNLMDYIGTCVCRSTVEHSPYWKANIGDIDLYFPSVESSAAFVKNVKEYVSSNSKDILIQDSSAGFGVNITCFGAKTTQIQAITKYTGTQEEITGTFDIYNAAIVLDGSKMRVPSDWSFLVKNKLLHVVRMNTPWTLNRISKWSRKHRFDNGLTPASVELLNKNFEEIIKSAVEFENSRRFQHMPRITESDFMRKNNVLDLRKSLSGENLMRMSMYYPNEAYNHAMKELVRRATVKDIAK